MEAKLNVKLLSHTMNPELVIACAGKLCYSSSNIEDLLEKQTPEMIEKFVKMLTSMGHESPLEHCSFTFAIEGVSRSLTHQLVRHRIASYSQQSQRYVKMDNCYIPDLPKGNGQKRHYNCTLDINQEEFIAEMYKKGYSTRELGKFYKKDNTTIKSIVNNYTKLRSNSESRFIKNDYFENIDNKTKAYILGFIVADGNICTKKDGSKMLSIEQLSNEDVLLQNILNEIKLNGKLHKTGNESTSKISVSSNVLCDNLNKLGIYDNKALNVRIDHIIQNLDKELIASFIRGIFDGDGHISINEEELSKSRLVFTGNEYVLSSIKNLLMDEIEVGMNLNLYPVGDNGTYHLIYNGKHQIKKIVEWLYSDVDIRFCHSKKIVEASKISNLIKDRVLDVVDDVVYEDYNCIIPVEFKNNLNVLFPFIRSCYCSMRGYRELVYNLGLNGIIGKKAIENARAVLPNACETKIICTMNLRTLINFCHHRCCRRAQDEIHALAWEIVKLIKEESPLLGSCLGANCQFGACPEGSMCCGNPYERVNK